MTYQSWHEEHATKHKNILTKLTHLSNNEIIEYFDFENMKVKEPDFCLLYSQNKKCHDIKNLNCYLCACPYFRVGSKSSTCDIKSKHGSSFESPDGFIHQDCSKCIIPHKKQYIKQNFNKDWKKIMFSTFN